MDAHRSVTDLFNLSFLISLDSKFTPRLGVTTGTIQEIFFSLFSAGHREKEAHQLGGSLPRVLCTTQSASGTDAIRANGVCIPAAVPA